MKYEIKELKADGNGYVVFTFDDGSTAGQFVTGMPVDDEVALRERLEAMAQEVEERAKETGADKQLSAGVRALLGTEVQIASEK